MSLVRQEKERLKKGLKIIKRDFQACGIDKEIVMDRSYRDNMWKTKIRIIDPTCVG